MTLRRRSRSSLSGAEAASSSSRMSRPLSRSFSSSLANASARRGCSPLACSSSIREARPSARKLPPTLRSRASAASASPSAYSIRASARFASALAGSSSSTLRRESASPASSSCWVSDGTSPSKNSSTSLGPFAPTNSAATSPLTKALTAGMPWMPNCWAMPGFSSVSIFASTTLPSRASAAFSRIGPSCRQGAHQGAQKSTTTGTSADRCTTAVSKSASLTSITVMGDRVGQALPRALQGLGA